MRAGGSKAKGNAFELEVVHLLRELTGLKDWYRVGISSGARATSESIADPRFQGDIFLDVDKANEDPRYKILADYFQNIVIEAKTTGQRINAEVFLSEKSFFNKWVTQAENESKGKDWILIFRYLASPVFACARKYPVLESLVGEEVLQKNRIALTVDGKTCFIAPIVLKIEQRKSAHEDEQESVGCSPRGNPQL